MLRVCGRGRGSEGEKEGRTKGGMEEGMILVYAALFSSSLSSTCCFFPPFQLLKSKKGDG